MLKLKCKTNKIVETSLLYINKLIDINRTGIFKSNLRYFSVNTILIG